MKTILLLLILTLATPAHSSFGKTYKYKDENGNTVFTDRPTEGSENIEIPVINTMETKRIENKPIDTQENPPEKSDSDLINIVDSYFFDKSSLQFHPEYYERVLRTYVGRIYYETITHPETWSFDIVRGKRRTPCKMLCRDEKYPEMISGGNMPMGVIRYLKSNICDVKGSH